MSKVHYSTIAAWPLAICQALQQAGVDPEPLLQQASLDFGQLRQNPDGRVPIDRMTHLWQLACQATANEAFGLSVARFVQPMHFRALGLVVFTCENMQQAIDKLALYHSLVSNTVNIRVIHQADSIGFAVDPLATVDISPLSIDAFFSTLYSIAQQLSGQQQVVKSVDLMVSPATDRQPWQQYFNCPVNFSSATNCLWFDRQVMLTTRIMGDAELLAANEQAVQRYLQQMQASAWRHKVEQSVLACIQNGEPSQADIAAQFNLSERSLRRYLQEENTSFRQCVQQVREDLACRLLADPTLTLSEVAYRSGFSDSSNFNRAFFRWKNTKPSDYRAGLEKKNLKK